MLWIEVLTGGKMKRIILVLAHHARDQVLNSGRWCRIVQAVRIAMIHER